MSRDVMVRLRGMEMVCLVPVSVVYESREGSGGQSFVPHYEDRLDLLEGPV
jgi:hypothetical protein